MSARGLLLSCLLCSLPALAGPRVLLLWDVKGPQTEALTKNLTDGGDLVTLGQTDSAHFNGHNPELTNFDVVVHMNGTTWQTEMPAEGQKALVRFVQNGGGYIHHEWNAYQLSVGQLESMRQLILFDRVSGYSGPITIHKVEGIKAHPVVWEVPKVFTMTGGSNIGHVHVFAEEPAQVLARDQNENDAVAIREYRLGRIVGFHHGGNWSYSVPTLLESSEARRLFVDAVRWAYGCDPSFREGRREATCAEIARLRAAK